MDNELEVLSRIAGAFETALQTRDAALAELSDDQKGRATNYIADRFTDKFFPPKLRAQRAPKAESEDSSQTSAKAVGRTRRAA